MSDVPVRQSVSFCMVEWRVFDSSKLGVYELGVYLALSRHRNQSHMAWPSEKRIADLIGISDRKVRSCLKVLEEAGAVIIRSRKNDHGGQMSNTYELTGVVCSEGVGTEYLGGGNGVPGGWERSTSEVEPREREQEEESEELKKAQSGPSGPLTLLNDSMTFGNMNPDYFELLRSIISKGGFTNRLPTTAKPEVTKTILRAYRDLQALGQGTFPQRVWNTDWLAREKLNPQILLPAMTFAELRKLCRKVAHEINADRKNIASLTKDLSTFLYNPKYHKSKFLEYVAEAAHRSPVSDDSATWMTDLYNKANAGWYDDVPKGYVEAWGKVAKALHAMTKENTDEVKRYLRENRALSNPLEHNRRAATPKTIVRLGAEFLASIRGGGFIPHPNAILPGAGSWSLFLEWLKQDQGGYVLRVTKRKWTRLQAAQKQEARDCEINGKLTPKLDDHLVGRIHDRRILLEIGAPPKPGVNQVDGLNFVEAEQQAHREILGEEDMDYELRIFEAVWRGAPLSEIRRLVG